MFNGLLVSLIVVGCILQGIFIMIEHQEKYVLADVLKGLASLCFVLIGFSAFKTVDSFYTKMIFFGLVFGLIGDVLLNLRFVFTKKGQTIFLAGILAFLIGHILYLIALISKAQHVWIWCCCLVGAVISACLLIYIFKTMEVKKAFKIFGVFYLSAVIIMTCISFGVAIFMPSTSGMVYALGALLFTLSDIVLIFNTFSGTTKFSLRITNLALYYIGQVLIALSLLLG